MWNSRCLRLDTKSKRSDSMNLIWLSAPQSASCSRFFNTVGELWETPSDYNFRFIMWWNNSELQNFWFFKMTTFFNFHRRLFCLQSLWTFCVLNTFLTISTEINLHSIENLSVCSKEVLTFHHTDNHSLNDQENNISLEKSRVCGSSCHLLKNEWNWATWTAESVDRKFKFLNFSTDFWRMLSLVIISPTY